MFGVEFVQARRLGKSSKNVGAWSSVVGYQSKAGCEHAGADLGWLLGQACGQP